MSVSAERRDRRLRAASSRSSGVRNPLIRRDGSNLWGSARCFILIWATTACSALSVAPSESVEKAPQSGYENVLSCYENIASDFVRGIKENRKAAEVAAEIASTLETCLQSDSGVSDAFCGTNSTGGIRKLAEHFKARVRVSASEQCLGGDEFKRFVATNQADHNVTQTAGEANFPVPLARHYFGNGLYSEIYFRLCGHPP